MRRRPRHSRRPRKGAGTALVLTLFFILLISALVVALLISMRIDRSTTQGYYQSARVQELANGALEDIYSDLRSEIAAGSFQSNVFIVNGKQIFVPKSALASQPARIGFAPGTNGDYATDADTNKLLPSLIRVSRAGVDTNAVFPATNYDQSKLPPQRASAVSSTNYSANGRTISPKRWNSSYLLSGSTNPPTRFSSRPPDWIYITRGGSRIVTDGEVTNLRPTKDLDGTNTVLGRYAYIIYDEGGLLDANCAGYPSTLSGQTNGPAAIRGKSSALYAALTSLPGLTNKIAEINALVEWRGKGSIQAAGDFISASTNWAQHGYLYVTNGDSPLLSRKDLIDYFTTKVGTTTPLPYLGTFSRYLAAPSARPVTPSEVPPGSQYDYGANADNSLSVNRDLANVRFAGSATVKHYADDGTSKSYVVKEGDPLLQSRFSLARLDWLKSGNPNTGSGPGTSSTMGQAIQQCFGLAWDAPGGSGASTMANGGNYCWNYVSPDGDGYTTGKIKTLAEVAALGREPDFFELLKAAILTGSTGMGPGKAAFINGTIIPGTAFNSGYYYPWGAYPDPDNGGANRDDTLKKGAVGLYCHTFGPASSAPSPARIPDLQIIRIGANIIDQYDADSWPTAIYFKFQGVGDNDPVSGSLANPLKGPVSMAYGIENLPYLQSMRQILASPQRSSAGTPGPGTDLATDVFAGWRQPYLWNPHQPPSQPLVDRPGRYEIRAYGRGTYTAWVWSNPAGEAAGKNYFNGYSNIVDYFISNSNSESCPIGTINFTLTSPNSTTAFCFYEAPFPLLENGLSGISASSPSSENTGNSSMAFYDENMPSPYNVPNHFVGFSTGKTPTDQTEDPYKPFYVSDKPGLTGRGVQEDKPTTYILGWLDSSNKFHPYSYLTGLFTFESVKLDSDERRVGTVNPNRGMEVWALADPRTERFSLARSIMAGFQETISVYRGNNQGWYVAGRPRAEAGFGGRGFFPSPSDYSYPMGDLMVNSASDPRPGETPPINSRINYFSSYGGGYQTGYYTDPDGVVRPGDGFYGDPATGDGLMTFIYNGAPNGASPSNSDKTVISHARRPVILNRPFRSVAELGYVFRDLPFKTLDFFTEKSADAALLDVFCLKDTATVGQDGLQTVAAGRINPNAASAPVLKAILQGGAKKEIDAGYNIQDEAGLLATAVADKVTQSGINSLAPFRSYRELIPTLTQATRVAIASLGKSSADKGNKASLEAPLRALSENTDFRTWNLMIDLIAQSGQISERATKASDFIVQSECRVWLHIAIDRYTGEVIARQLEPVYE